MSIRPTATAMSARNPLLPPAWPFGDAYTAAPGLQPEQRQQAEPEAPDRDGLSARELHRTIPPRYPRTRLASRYGSRRHERALFLEGHVRERAESTSDLDEYTHTHPPHSSLDYQTSSMNHRVYGHLRSRSESNSISVRAFVLWDTVEPAHGINAISGFPQQRQQRGSTTQLPRLVTGAENTNPLRAKEYSEPFRRRMLEVLELLGGCQDKMRHILEIIFPGTGWSDWSSWCDHNQFECRICFEERPFSSTVTMHCGHVMCSGCLFAHMASATAKECPFCRSRFL